MATENRDLRNQALESLKGNWVIAIVTFLIVFILTGGAGGIEEGKGGIISVIIAGPLAVGVATFSLALSRGQKADIEMVFVGFKNFVNALIAYLLVVIFTFGWLLLLIVPGIIKAISYSMTFFIMAEDDSIKPMDAIDKSMAMMDGYKMKYFLLSLLFLVFILLSAILLFIPLLWLVPYMHVTYAKFYDDIKYNPAMIE
ncbi:MAG: DUF975 family protein [Bacteroidota bacterium]